MPMTSLPTPHLATRQYHPCSHIRVLQQLQGDKLVVSGGFRVVQDVAQLLQVDVAAE